MHGKMKNRPGPFGSLATHLPSLNITALSYSFMILIQQHMLTGNVRKTKKYEMPIKR
jgi:hypothetical protein